ncbi:phosphotransferase [Streptomyces sp. YIM S03343]
MTHSTTVPAPLRSWAEQQVGPITAVQNLSHPLARSRVWHLELEGRPGVVLKAARGPLAYQRECFAHRHAVPSLGSGAAPQLIESSPQHLGLLLTRLPGRPLAEQDMTRAERGEAYRQAGALLSRLHTAGDLRGEHAAEAEQALQRAAHSARSHLAAAGDRVSPAEHRLVQGLASDLLRLGPLPLGFLHGDAWGHNLIWSGGRAAWTGFERARFGAVVQDFAPLYGEAWTDDPRQRTAVLRGYGRELSPQEEYALVCLSALDAVSCLVRDPEQGDREVTARGHRILDRLMTEVHA